MAISKTTFSTMKHCTRLYFCERLQSIFVRVILKSMSIIAYSHSSYYMAIFQDANMRGELGWISVM